MAYSQPDKKVYQVAILIHPHAEILDFTGPMEMFSETTYNNDTINPERAFGINLISREHTVSTGVPTGNCMEITAHMTIEEASKHIETFDILVVPGGNSPLLLEYAKEKSPEFRFVESFTQLQSKEKQRVLMSVCTGAALIVSTGAFAGMKATTHHMCYDELKQHDESIDVVRGAESGGTMRYVDGGLTKNGLRVVSTGGVSCGMDGALYVAELKVGRERAEFAAKMAEYDWKRTEV